MNGDSFCRLNLAALLNAHHRAHVLATLAVVAADGRADGGAVSMDLNGRISSFHEKGVSGSYLNAGVYVCDARFMEHIPDRYPCSLEQDVFPSLLAQGLHGYITHEPLYDIGTPERLNAIRTVNAQALIHPTEGRATC